MCEYSLLILHILGCHPSDTRKQRVFVVLILSPILWLLKICVLIGNMGIVE